MTYEKQPDFSDLANRRGRWKAHKSLSLSRSTMDYPPIPLLGTPEDAVHACLQVFRQELFSAFEIRDEVDAALQFARQIVDGPPALNASHLHIVSELLHAREMTISSSSRRGGGGGRGGVRGCRNLHVLGRFPPRCYHRPCLPHAVISPGRRATTHRCGETASETPRAPCF